MRQSMRFQARSRNCTFVVAYSTKVLYKVPFRKLWWLGFSPGGRFNEPTGASGASARNFSPANPPGNRGQTTWFLFFPSESGQGLSSLAIGVARRFEFNKGVFVETPAAAWTLCGSLDDDILC